MIPNFPQPFRDELFYSWVARHQWLMLNRNYANTSEKLLGKTNARVLTGLPTRLSNFAAAIGRQADVDHFIRCHTLLPVHAPFMASERLDKVVTAMKGNGHRSGGVMNWGTGSVGTVSPDYLRFCPACATDERATTGEAYWHRLHHVPGILVCSVHDVMLEESSAAANDLRRLHAAESVIDVKEPKRLEISNAEHSLLLRLSVGAAWLLENWIPGNEPSWLHERYWQLAIRRAFISPSGSILWKNLLPSIQQRYSPSVLMTLNCSIPQKAFNYQDFWLTNLLRDVERVQPPIRHLLLMDFLGVSAREFFDPDFDKNTLGAAPRKCENPVCPQHGNEVVNVTHEYYRRKKMARLRLSCLACGRKSFLVTVAGQERSYVSVYGEVWDAVLTELWKDQSLAINDIARKLGVKNLTVKRQAVRLDLQFPREGGGYAADVNGLHQPGNGIEGFETKRSEKREEWLALRKEHPAALTCELLRLAPRCYGWLWEHDRDWHAQNCPPRQRAPVPWIRQKEPPESEPKSAQQTPDETGLTAGDS
jgi:hypothetical protein